LVTKPFVKEGSFGIFLKGKNFENEINIAQKDNGQNNGKNNNFEYKSHPSLTSNESKVLIINYK
ncbi:MAG: 16S rRNA G527 N7-methylase RsmG, partial [Rickettsiales bacterium]